MEEGYSQRVILQFGRRKFMIGSFWTHKHNQLGSICYWGPGYAELGWYMAILAVYFRYEWL